jgi:hypothetical protein
MSRGLALIDGSPIASRTTSLRNAFACNNVNIMLVSRYSCTPDGCWDMKQGMKIARDWNTSFSNFAMLDLLLASPLNACFPTDI